MEIHDSDSPITCNTSSGNCDVQPTWSASTETRQTVGATSLNAGGTSPVSCSPDYGDLFSIGENVVTCTGADAAGNIGTLSFTITVNTSSQPTSSDVAVVVPGPDIGTPGCELTNSCFTPYETNIGIGDSVTWQVSPSSPVYVVSSGTPASGPSGHFSGQNIMLLSTGAKGQSLTHEFTDSGTYYYFDMVHPWALGKVLSLIHI